MNWASKWVEFSVSNFLKERPVEVKLWCAVYGEATVFPVKIAREAEVSALQEAIFYKQRYNHQYKFAASALTLYLAKKNGAWLKHDNKVKDFLRGQIDKEYEEIWPSWKLNDPAYFGDFQLGQKEIQVLVELPEVAAEKQSGLWLVRGSIENALRTKGLRCRLYRLAGSYLGYYNLARRTGDNDSALWYEDTKLCNHVLFKTKDNALRFENALKEEQIMLGSPLNGQQIVTRVQQVVAVATELRRIFFVDYKPQESESPQDTLSSISLSSSVTVLDSSTDEYRYQRIEQGTSSRMARRRVVIWCQGSKAKITSESSANTIMTRTIGLHSLARCMGCTTG